MSAQEKLARYNSMLDQLSQMKIQLAQIGFVPQTIMMQHQILEALILKEIKDLAIIHNGE